MAEITSLSIVAGTPAHVTVVDANSADAPLPNASITWANDSPTVLGITADPAGGFILDATSGGTAHITATYRAGTVHVTGPVLTVNMAVAVMPAYVSP